MGPPRVPTRATHRPEGGLQGRASARAFPPDPSRAPRREALPLFGEGFDLPAPSRVVAVTRASRRGGDVPPRAARVRAERRGRGHRAPPHAHVRPLRGALRPARRRGEEGRAGRRAVVAAKARSRFGGFGRLGERGWRDGPGARVRVRQAPRAGVLPGEPRRGGCRRDGVRGGGGALVGARGALQGAAVPVQAIGGWAALGGGGGGGGDRGGRRHAGARGGARRRGRCERALRVERVLCRRSAGHMRFPRPRWAQLSPGDFSRREVGALRRRGNLRGEGSRAHRRGRATVREGRAPGGGGARGEGGASSLGASPRVWGSRASTHRHRGGVPIFAPGSTRGRRGIRVVRDASSAPGPAPAARDLLPRAPRRYRVG
mmetsp:Transcript_10990/g.45758  ORF Transcript_10990/g.45758 Transcript_10990/m.45758 type:complete len:374 (-) Transcript_10990:1222-2343(-)